MIFQTADNFDSFLDKLKLNVKVMTDKNPLSQWLECRKSMKKGNYEGVQLII